MKNLITVIAICLALNTFAQLKADDIIGTYMTDKNEGMVEITKRGSKYYGKLLWTVFEGKLDTNNPIVAEKTIPLKGKEIIKDFDFNGLDMWNNGSIYDPKNGKTYNCKINRTETGNLSVRGYIGISMLGRTTMWIKVKK